jgi:predicted HTH transcriptional regulator
MMSLWDWYNSIELSDVYQFISNQQEENIFLEFKTVSSENLSDRGDRKNLAKALSGFANSSRGLIVWGVDARKNLSDIDCASRYELAAEDMQITRGTLRIIASNEGLKSF